jgi:hypothetical protein
VRYRGLYPGVDLEVFGEGGGWDWRWVAQNPNDLGQVKLRIQGAKKVEVHPTPESLHIFTDSGELFLPLPLAGTAPLPRPEIKFEEEHYEVWWPFALSREKALRPKSGGTSSLIYSGILGGNSIEQSYSIAVDVNGAAYVTGETWSSDFPTTPGAFDRSYEGFGGEAFVVKVNPSGTGLAYATFLGGSDWDRGLSIAVDATGAAYITGWTFSSDFPTTPGAFNRTDKGAFVVKLNPLGTGLAYATFLGKLSMGYGIAVDTSGAAYVTGETGSSEFPTTSGAFDRSYGGARDAFVLKLNSSGTALVYSSFLGGRDEDIGRSIAVDASGAAYVTGETRSPDFPTTRGAYDTTYGGGTCSDSFLTRGCPDAFVVKVSPSGKALEYATFLGGSNWDRGLSLAIDANGAAYVTGETNSLDFRYSPSLRHISGRER